MNNKVYEIITNQIIEKLESGVIPWQKPWKGDAFAPKNLVTKKEYRGINPFILNMSTYDSPFWVSFKQAKQLGGKVKKGEKSTMVCFYKISKYTVKKDNGEDEEKKSFILRYYNVFNVEQITGIDESKIPDLAEHYNDNESLEICEAIIENMKLRPEMISKDKGRAYYSPSKDIVNLPELKQFKSSEAYYATAFHELVHSTGHKKRLDRKEVTEIDFFDGGNYSREELVAEFGASFLCGHAGIEKDTIENAASYIKGWLQKLKGDSKAVIIAAAQAQKAADYILGITPNYDK